VNPRARLGYCFRAELVYQWCGVCPVLAVVAGVPELDVDEDDALVVGAVDAGADVAILPADALFTQATSYCDLGL
jgi:hypothetical protein